jgi:hypothetical protein
VPPAIGEQDALAEQEERHFAVAWWELAKRLLALLCFYGFLQLICKPQRSGDDSGPPGLRARGKAFISGPHGARTHGHPVRAADGTLAA